MRDVEGLSALVTGGASGIGAASTALLAERGARVAVADLARPAEVDHLALTCDVTDRSSVAAAVAAVVEAFRRAGHRGQQRRHRRRWAM
jgi:NAD(P)-dependent dehydrogenase (short-subunit alcohol dehydrogenase family)